MFIWHIGSGSLPTKLNFVQKVGHGDPVCPLCGLENESFNHLFFNANALEQSGLDKVGVLNLTLFLL